MPSTINVGSRNSPSPGQPAENPTLLRGLYVPAAVGSALTSAIQPSLPVLLVRHEEGALDVARLALQLSRKVPDDHQELMPVAKAEPNGPGVPCHRAQRVKQLPDPDIDHAIARSEEHTSELQSLAYLVCRLLLEKKKNTSQSLSSIRQQ